MAIKVLGKESCQLPFSLAVPISWNIIMSWAQVSATGFLFHVVKAMYIFTRLFLVENVLRVVLCSHYRLFYLLKSQIAAFNLWNHFVPYCFFNSFICVVSWSLRSTVPVGSQQDTALALPCYSGDFENEIYFFFLKPNHLNWSQCQIQILLATLAQKQLLCLPKDEILPQRWHLVIVGEKDFFKKK